MAASAGSVAVKLLLDASEYFSGLSKAEQAANRFAQSTMRASGGRLASVGADAAAREFQSAAKAAQQFGKATSSAANEANVAMRSVSDTARSVKATLGTVIAAFGAREVVLAADSWATLNQRMRIVAPGANDLKIVMGEVLNIAQETRQPIKQVGDLYFRLAQATQQIGFSQADTLKVTKLLSQALIVSGASGVAADAAMVQFAQGLQSGRFSGQEFNSVNEQANRIIVALADGLGVATADMRKLAEAGDLKPPELLRALLSQVEKVGGEFRLIPDTIAGAFIRVQNKFVEFIGTTSDAVGAVGAIVSALQFLSKHLAELGTIALGVGLGVAVKTFASLGKVIQGAVAPVLTAAAAHRTQAAALQLVQIEETKGLAAKTASTAATVKSAEATLADAVANRADITTLQQLTAVELENARALGARAIAQQRVNALAGLGTQQAAITKSVTSAQNALMLANIAAGTAAAHAALKTGAQAVAVTGLGTAAAATGRALLALVGGPIGAVLTALTIGATLWSLFGKSSADAAQSMKRSSDDIIADLDRQIAKVKEQLTLMKQLKIGVPKTETELEVARLQLQRKNIQTSIAGGSGEEIGARGEAFLRDEIARLEKVAATTKITGRIGRDLTAGAKASLAATTEQIAAAKRKLATGDVFGPGVEAFNKDLQASEKRIQEVTGRMDELSNATQEHKALTADDNVKKWMEENAKGAAKYAIELKKLQDLHPGKFLEGSPEQKLLFENMMGKSERAAAAKAQREAEAVLRALVDGRLRELEDGVRAERDILKFRDAELQASFKDELISYDDFYEQRRELINQNLNREIDLNKEKASEVAAAREEFTKQQDRIKFTNKIADIDRDSAAARREAAQATQQSFRDQQRAAESFSVTVADLGIQLAELRGHGEDALAGIRFDLKNRELQAQIDLQKTSLNLAVRLTAEVADRQLQAMRELTIQHAKFARQQQDIDSTFGALGRGTTLIDLQASRGAFGEIEALQRKSELNKQILVTLRAQAEALAEVAVTREQLEALENLKVRIEEIAAATDLAGDHFRDMFGDAFGSSLADFITGTKSAKDAFNDFVKSVTRQISDIASKNIADALFKGEGPLAGIGGFFGKVFGGGPKGTPGIAPGIGGAADAAGMAALATSASAAAPSLALVGTNAALTTAPLTLLATNAGLAASALASITAASAANAGGSLFEDLIGSISGGGWGDSGTWGMFTRAGGGLLGRNQPSIVGENGPELFVPQVQGRVMNTNELQHRTSHSKVYHMPITVMVPPNMSRESASQFAGQLGLRIQRAVARDK